MWGCCCLIHGTAHHRVPCAVGPALIVFCPHPRFLQPHDTGHVHTDVFLPGLLDLRPDSVCRSLHPLPADRGSLGEALWHLPVLPNQGLGESCLEALAPSPPPSLLGWWHAWSWLRALKWAGSLLDVFMSWIWPSPCPSGALPAAGLFRQPQALLPTLEGGLGARTLLTISECPGA